LYVWFVLKSNKNFRNNFAEMSLHYVYVWFRCLENHDLCTFLTSRFEWIQLLGDLNNCCMIFSLIFNYGIKKITTSVHLGEKLNPGLNFPNEQKKRVFLTYCIHSQKLLAFWTCTKHGWTTIKCQPQNENCLNHRTVVVTIYYRQ